MKHLALLLLSVGLWAADPVAPGPWSVRLGWSGANSELRTLTNRDGLTAGVGLILPQRGLVSRMGGDVDWRAGEGEGRYDAVSAVYAERVAIANGVYAGAGAGVSVLRLVGPGWSVITARPTGKAIIGWMPSWRTPTRQRVAFEGAWFATDRVHGVRTDGITLTAVLGF
jgi:hypothetical protein